MPRVLYEGVSAGVRGYCMRVLVPGYEGVNAGVRGYCMRVLEPGYEGIV